MDNHFKFTNSVVECRSFVLFLWFVYWLEIRFVLILIKTDFSQNIYWFAGFSPFFIHSDLNHLYNNSMPLLVLLLLCFFFYAKQAFPVIAYGILFSGILTWLIEGLSYHTSGLVFSSAYLFWTDTRLVALSLAVIMYVVEFLWYAFPKVDDTISWEAFMD
jgi:hypothetical protein